MSEYSSERADMLEAFVKYRIASNRWSSVPAKNLIYFDRYCSREFPDIPGISQHMIDIWCRQRETEGKLSQINRCYPVIQLVKYLIERGDHSLRVPEMPPSPKKSHVPHAFSEDELSAFFHECDKRIQAAPDKAKAFRALTVAVLFRLLYSSGMRTTEARLLRTLDVDLENAVINIRETKGDMQHYVALYQDVVKMLFLYNQATQRICPNRNIFFPGKGGEPLSASMLEYEFHKVWDSISTAKAVPYDFRHNYAIMNINAWIGKGFEFHDKFLYLSKSMGHTSLESTKYYYALVPAMADILDKESGAVAIAKYISSFLCDYAPLQLTNSENTIHSYEVALTLYVGYLEDSRGIGTSGFSKRCFEQTMIEDWLEWLSLERGCSPETCNNRLSSLRTFIKYLASRETKYLYLKSEADNVPLRKTTKKKVNGLTRNAVAAILAEPDQRTKTGVRDLTFLTVLYGTVARIDEILSMKIGSLRLDFAKPYANIVGKGDKVRTLYLPPRAAAHLKQYIRIFHGTDPDTDAYVFYSRNIGPSGKMSQAAIRKMLKKYAVTAHEKCSDVPLDLHAHQFRHAKATHWLEDGVNIVQISFLLGHEQLDTTMRYLDITTEQEIAALSTLEEERHKNIRPK